MAKRPALDEGKQREICAILTVGGTRRVAAQYVGCAVGTIRRTADRDPAFAKELRRAESSNEVAYLQSIRTAAKDARYWRAAAWALERKYPQRYAQRRSKEVTPQQLAVVLTELAKIISDEVPDVEHRKNILSRLAEMSEGLCKGRTSLSQS